MPALLQNVADELLIDPPYRDTARRRHLAGRLRRRWSASRARRRTTTSSCSTPRLAVDGLKYRFLQGQGPGIRRAAARLHRAAEQACGPQRAASSTSTTTRGACNEDGSRRPVAVEEPPGHADAGQGEPAAKVAHLGAPLKGSVPGRRTRPRPIPISAPILTNCGRRRRPHHRAARLPQDRPARRQHAGLDHDPLLRPASDNLRWLPAISIYDLAGGGDSPSAMANDNWSWTSFSNLSSVDYTIMVNGFRGVGFLGRHARSLLKVSRHQRAKHGSMLRHSTWSCRT